MGKHRLFLILFIIAFIILTALVFNRKNIKINEDPVGIETKADPPMDFEFKDKLLSDREPTPVPVVQIKKEPEKKPRLNKKSQVRSKPQPAAKPSNDKSVQRKYLFLIQTSSFRDIAQAQEEKARLKNDFFPIEIHAVDLGEKGVWYRVIIGPVSESTKNEYSLKLEEKYGIRALVRKVQ